MMNLKQAIPYFLLCSLFVGCASTTHDKDSVSNELVKSEGEPSEKSSLSPEQQLAEAFHILDQRIKNMVETAKKEGPEAIEFLASDLFLKANDASMRGDSHTAAYLFKHLMDLKPKDHFLKKKYSVELIRMGSLAEAREVLVSLMKETNYEDETLGLILGGVYTALDEKENARTTYQEVMKKHPSSEEACIFLAKSYALSDKFKSAHQLLNKCYKENKKASFAYYDGKVFLKEGKSKQAIRKFNTALKVDPEYYQAAMAIGLTHEEDEHFDKAIKTYKSFLKKSPESYPVLSRLVQLLFSEEKFKEVLPYAESLSSLDASDLNLKVRLGILYTDNRDYDKAIGIFKEILVAVPESDKVLYYLGTLYQEVKQLDNAIEFFGKIPATSTLFADSSLQMAKILQILVQIDDQKWSGRYLSFLQDRGGKVDALKVEFQIMMATYYESKMKYQDAITSINKVRHVNDYNENHEYYLASLYEKVKDFASSRDIIRDILKKDPDNADAMNFLGYSLLESNENLDEAFRLISKAVELKPEDGYIRDSLGWFYYKTGKIDLALVEIKKAFELVKTDVVITKHLAIIYRDLEKFEMAKKYFVEALKNCKLDSERKDIIDSLGPLQEMRLPASSVMD